MIPQKEAAFWDNKAFWSILDRMTENSKIVIDWPKDSRHPGWGNIVYVSPGL